MTRIEEARKQAAALYAAARVEFTALLARRGELEQDVIDATAVANVIADSRNGRAPAVPQTGQWFALVHAAPRKTGAVLAFRTEASVGSEGPDALFFKPHGTPAEQRQKLEPENYLLHAAYGLFAFSSRFDGAERLSRLQTFHFGRQTFADTPGNRVSDIAGSEGITAARFFGRAMGWLLTGAGSADKSADSRISGRHRIRGTVELSLDIFSSDPASEETGFIFGAVENLQIETGPGWWSSDASDVLGAGTADALRGSVQLNVLENTYYPTVTPTEQAPRGNPTADSADDWNLRNDGTYSGAADHALLPAQRGLERLGRRDLRLRRGHAAIKTRDKALPS